MDFVWFGWSCLFLVFWGVVYASLRIENRREMREMSGWTALLAFTEPVFVPTYWNPPSLFDLAQRTGFDIESFIFCFSIGGLAVALYEKVFPVIHEPIPGAQSGLRRWIPVLVVLTAPAVFAVLDITLQFNPIYSAFIALTGAGVVMLALRPDLFHKMVLSGLLFLAVYFVYFLTLLLAAPGYVEQVWNIHALSGITVGGIPLEELLFAASFGFCWSGIYEFVFRRRIKRLDKASSS